MRRGRYGAPIVDSAEQLLGQATRREFLRAAATGGCALLLPGVFAACANDTPAGPGPGGTPEVVTLDFGDERDVGVLNYAYALEQLQAAFYEEVLARSGAALSDAERATVADIRDHELLHRELLRAVLGPSAIATLSTTPAFAEIDFASRDAVLATARSFEDLSVAAYNGVAQYLRVDANLALVAKMASVEARHAATVRDLLSPDAATPADAFAPLAYDDALDAPDVGEAVASYVAQRLLIANKPAFVRSPAPSGA
jgi:rubrerythrin